MCAWNTNEGKFHNTPKISSEMLVQYPLLFQIKHLS